MNVVIAGGTGLIGTHIIKRLTAEGYSTVLLTRNPARVVGSLGEKVKAVAWDRKTAGDWTEHLEGADGVINLSGESIGGGRWTPRQKERIIASRVDAARAIVQGIGKTQKKLKVLVNASAVGYYGHVEDGDITEDHPAGNDFLADTCKRWELAASEAENYDVRVVLIRTGFVLAKDAPAFKKMLLPFKLFTGGPYGSGKQWFPWVHIDDVVAAYVFALQNSNLRGPVNVAAPDPQNIKQFTRLVGKVMRRPSWTPAPAFALRLALGEMADLLLKGQKVVPKKLLESGYAFRFQTAEGALRDVLRG